MQKASDWHHWFFLHRHDSPRPLKSEIAQQLGISSAEFSKRLDPERYRPLVSEEEVRITARIWGQPVTYVERMFPRRKAA